MTLKSYDECKRNKLISNIPPEYEKKAIKFEYFGEDINIFTKICKNTTVKWHIALIPLLTLIVKQKVQYTYNSNVYRLKCLICDQIYRGQTRIGFRPTVGTRHKHTCALGSCCF
jgi:FAD synthase